MVLLTGATGFLGSKLLAKLLENNIQVVLLKRSNSNTNGIKYLVDKVVSYDIDVTPLELVFIENNIECVIHLACDYGKGEPNLFNVVNSNLVFGLHLLDACIKFNVGYFINADTFLDKNINSYSLTKKQFVEWLIFKSESLNIANLKIEYIYGPNDDKSKFIPSFIEKLRENGGEIELTSGGQFRDFIFIDDVVNAFYTILINLERIKGFVEYEVGTGTLTSLRSFLEIIKHEYELLYGETNTILGFGKLLHRKGEKMNFNLNNKSLLRMGWSPNVNIIEGAKMILKKV